MRYSRNCNQCKNKFIFADNNCVIYIYLKDDLSNHIAFTCDDCGLMQRVYYSAKGLLKVINNLDGTLKHFELPPDAVRIEARKKRANTKGAAIDNHRLTAEENKILNMFTEDIKNLSTEEVDKLRESESNFDSSDTDTE